MEPGEAKASPETGRSQHGSWLEISLLTIGMLLPSLVTYLFFVAVAEQPSWVQQLVAAAGKALQFSLPIVWWFAFRRTRQDDTQRSQAGLAIGLGFGCAVLAVIWLAYGLLIRPGIWLPQLPQEVALKVNEIGCDTPVRFLVLGCFYVFIHSLLEEYYWRWFTFGGLRRYFPFSAAMLISSIGFSAHHVIVLARFLGWLSPATWLLALAVGVGGAFWAWLYERSGRLYAPWISHLVVDAAIFTLGYTMVF